MTYQELRDALAAGLVSHTRAGDRLHRGSVLVYTPADTPSGVVLLGVVPDSPEFADLLRGQACPLSPTERY